MMAILNFALGVYWMWNFYQVIEGNKVSRSIVATSMLICAITFILFAVGN